MTARKIDTSAPKFDREITVNYDFGDNIKDAIRMFGEQIVYEHFYDNARIALQGFIRSRLTRTGGDFMTDASIKAAVKNSFKLGGRTVDPSKRLERVAKDIARLDDKTRAKLFREWQRANEKQAGALVKTPKPQKPTEVIDTPTEPETNG